MKKLSKILSIVMLTGYIVPVSAYASEKSVWDGSVDTSWYSDEIGSFDISTPQQLAGFAQLVNEGKTFQNKKVSLVSDIILNEGEIVSESGIYTFSSGKDLNEWIPIGTYQSTSTRGFRGTFEGNNHVIEGVYMDCEETDYQGLFGISFGCTITDLKVKNSLFITEDALSVGGIIAGVPDGINTTSKLNIERCLSETVITDNNSSSSQIYAGGIVGRGHTKIAARNITINIEDCEFSGVIDIDSNENENIAGGIIGKSAKLGTISGCNNSGSVSAANAGGICAISRTDAVIEYCYNAGDVNATGYAGGIIGDTAAETAVRYSYNAGKVSGVSGSGAIVGNNTKEGEYINNIYLVDSADYAYRIAEENFSDVEGKAVLNTVEELKSNSVLKILNAQNSVYTLPENDYNKGYPVIANVYYKGLYEGKYTVSEPVITGEIALDKFLTLSYIAEGEPNALKLITWQWQVCDTKDGIYTVLDEKTKDLKITLDIYNKYIKAVLSLPTGEKMETEPVLVSNADFEGVIDNIEIRGIMKSGNTLSIDYDSENVTDAHIISYKWERSTTADGSYMEVGNDKIYQTNVATSTYYYRASVILINGKGYTSQPVEVVGRNNFSYNNSTHHAELVGMRNESDKEYGFTVTENGKTYEFLLLDAEPSSDSGRFLVYADQTYGTGYPYDEMNDGAFIELLPDAIAEHLDKTVFHEGSVNGFGVYNQELYGIGAISVPELIKYKDIIGARVYSIDDKEKENIVIFGTRTNSCRTDSGGYVVSIKAHTDGKISVYDRDYQCDNHLNDKITNVCNNCVRSDAFGHANSCGVEIRPIFYIDKDFFKDEDIDIESLGKKAAEIIGKNADKADMLTKYNRKTLENVFCFAPDFVINSAMCKDMSDNQMTGITAGEFKVYANIASNCDEKNARVIVAIYDSEGVLEAVSSTAFDCNKNQSKNVEINFSGVDYTKELKVKISVLGTDDNLLSVTDITELF